VSISPLVAHSILNSIGITLLGTVLSGIVALLVAFVAGLARISSNFAVRSVASVYVEVFRGASAIVLLFWGFYVLPSVGITLSPMFVGIPILGLNAGAYASEIVRGAVLAVPRGQWEAALALNMSPRLRMWKVILPQAVPAMIPSFGNVLIDVLKGTSLFSLITIADLTHAVNELAIIGAVQLVPAFTFLLGMYFFLSLPFVALIRHSEHLSRRHLPSGHLTHGS
jgi:polar amino acid transport system permease protein